MSSIKIKIKKETKDKIVEICNSFNNSPKELINILHKTQDFLGYLPAEAQEVIAEQVKVPTAKVYGIVSFYSFFTMIPKGKHPISVCMGTACYVRGAEKVLDEFKHLLNIKVGETDSAGKFSLASLRCVGACGLAPVALIGGKVYGRLAPDDIKKILSEYDDCECQR
ncbi:MAG TPA: NAD(P)H-dependent oxidoreductase subunit E [Bacteroidales bacterium]|jgi:NADP-reducing hydrogenase subunit HndA|nr:NAD(P)H-dependent oxidoreductase subunit E [Bacteroidales bacterium]HOF45195.1 NAD(P)H-dependent oxidoreductase subunit E [Bacteroidales bacterium]HOS58147.1 NAD(P)H-dependent oxidoreductase subunit E [Bacteroidales bacterium]HRR04282.1 NAD(P)H-dependent oxidoreductase subunit E [Bacteroidales bacterium]HRT13850.1 NAD(P)H-dependent oxidoreductase subunit E [Bacteroidales bacterium]